MYCEEKCCYLTIIPVKNYKTIPYTFKKRNQKKAGVVVYNSRLDKILIVQSKGKLWGFPKGSLEQNETLYECAIRELKEETGILLDFEELLKLKRVFINKSLYFLYDVNLYDINEEIGKVQEDDPFNDVNGLGWIKFQCLEKLWNSSKLKLNYQCRYILSKEFDKNYI